jgi:hypothetical protein
MTLAQVNTAIEAILSDGQSHSIDGVTYSAANLGTLTALRDKLMAETARTTRPMFRAFGFRSMGYGDTGVNDPEVVRTVAL